MVIQTFGQTLLGIADISFGEEKQTEKSEDWVYIPEEAELRFITCNCINAQWSSHLIPET